MLAIYIDTHACHGKRRQTARPHAHNALANTCLPTLAREAYYMQWADRATIMLATAHNL